MLVNEHSEQAMRKDWEVVEICWAVLGMRERLKWEKGHQLYRQAFWEPKSQLEKKEIGKDHPCARRSCFV